MVTIIGMWESGWLDPRVEAFMWRQLISAYQVDKFIMTPKSLSERTSVIQYVLMENALASVNSQKVFVCPPGRHEREVDIKDFNHPDDACYIFGKAGETLARFITKDDQVLTITTPGSADMFAISVAGTILNERR